MLNALAIENRDNDPERSLSVAERALASAYGHDHLRGIAWGLLNVGYLKDFQGRKAEAISDLSEALERMTALDDREGLGYAYKYLCFYHWGLGDTKRAIDLMMKGLRLNEGSGTVIEGWALFVIGNFYSDLGDHSLAAEYLERALAVFEPLAYEHGLGRSYNALSTVRFREGDLEHARALAQRALEIHDGSAYRMGISRSHNDLGAVLSAQGDLDGAAAHLERALSIREQVRNPQAMISTLMALAGVQQKRSDAHAALAFLTRARAIGDEIDAKAKLVGIHRAIIDVYRELDDPWKALDHWQSAFDLRSAVLEQDAQSRIEAVESSFLAERKEREAEIAHLRSLQLKREKDTIELLFGQQVSVEVVGQLLREYEEHQEGANRPPRRTTASIMFLDIRDFSRWADSKDPAEVIGFQNAVFGPLIDILGRHDGILHQILGDGFMATFGLLSADDAHARDGYRAGIAIVDAIRRLTAEGVIPATRVGIGLHTGEITTGNIGTERRQQYSISGRAVNLSARVEQLNKRLGSEFLVTRAVVDALDPDAREHEPECAGSFELKGFEEPVEVWRVA